MCVLFYVLITEKEKKSMGSQFSKSTVVEMFVAYMNDTKCFPTAYVITVARNVLMCRYFSDVAGLCFF